MDVKILDEIFQKEEKAIISVHGKSKYVVMDFEHSNYLRECELETVVIQTHKDIKEGLLTVIK